MTTATTGVHPMLEPLRVPACEGKAGYHDFAPDAPVADSVAELGPVTLSPLSNVRRVRGGWVVKLKHRRAA